MKQKRIKRIIMCVLALVTLFAFSSIASASGNRTGRAYSQNGTYLYNETSNMSSDEVTAAMSLTYTPNYPCTGYLYGWYSKAVALINPSVNCLVDRVRIQPDQQIGNSDLRINPNYSSNWVGDGKNNLEMQVRGVQTALDSMGYYIGSTGVDGVWGANTKAAVRSFQSDHGLSADGIVGANSWRALCSSSSYRYGSTIW